MEDDDRLGLAQVGDDPISNATQDKFDRQPFAARAADLIRGVAASSPSLVAGLIGPWGSGKTSVVVMIAERRDPASVGGCGEPVGRLTGPHNRRVALPGWTSCNGLPSPAGLWPWSPLWPAGWSGPELRRLAST